MSTLSKEIEWGEEISPATVSMKDEGVKEIISVYASQLSEGLHPGSQLVVLRNGHVVVDRADGFANVRRNLKVTPNTPFNLPFIRSAVIPAATPNSTARDLAVFFQMMLNRGSYAGKEYLKPDTAAKAISLGYEGYDDHLKENIRWGFGFDLGGLTRPTDPPRSGMGTKSSLSIFGHIGQNCCIVWADSKEELVVSFTTNQLLSGEKSKEMFNSISNAVWDAVL